MDAADRPETGEPADRSETTTERRRRWTSNPWLQFALMVLLLSVVLILVRGWLLWTAGMQNPDEAELMAEGRTAALDLFPYSDYTSSTHLFLWPFLLGLLSLLGIPMTIVWAHVIGGFMYVLVVAMGWFVLMRRIGWVRAGLFVVVPGLVLLIGRTPGGGSDFLSMTSEALPMVILALAAVVMLGTREPLGTGRLIAGSMIAGLAIWGKPQSGPLAVALVAACVFVGYVEQHRSDERVRFGSAALAIIRSGFLALLAFLTPTVVFVVVMWIGGTLDDFGREPLAAMWNYTAHRDTSQGIAAPPLGDRLTGVLSFARSFPFAALWTLGAIMQLSLLGRVRSWLLKVVGLVAVVLPALASLACLVPIYPLFPHYANFFYLGCLLSTLVAVRLVVPGERDRRWARRLEPLVLAVSLALVATLAMDEVPDRAKGVLEQTGHAMAGNGFDFGNSIPESMLGGQCPAGKRVLVWGWASELYAYYDWTPPSRYVNSTWVLYPSANQATYGRIMLDELEKNPPDCIIEALGGQFFAGISPEATLAATIPAATDLLRTCYMQPFESYTFDGRLVIVYGRTATCRAGGD